MLRGKVSKSLRPYIELEISGVKLSAKLGIIVDTGSTYPLILSAKIIKDLELRPTFTEIKIRGIDGNIYYASTYECSIRWNGVTQNVVVAESPEKSLLGMPLMEGLNLQIQVNVGGDVTIS
jgi:predicted aspartyl protease